MILSAVIRNFGVSATPESPGGAVTSHIVISKPHNIGSWNIRGILQPGKLCLVERKMEMCNINILSLSETHQKDKGYFRTSAGNQIMYLGNGINSKNGVAVIVDKKYSLSII